MKVKNIAQFLKLKIINKNIIGDNMKYSFIEDHKLKVRIKYEKNIKK